MENGVGFDAGEGTNLAQQLSALTISGAASINDFSNNTNNVDGMNKSDGLFQVMKAVEAAEATIKQQVEENHRLRSELQKKIQELEQYKADGAKTGGHPVEYSNDHGYILWTKNRAVSPSLNQKDGIRMVKEPAIYDQSKIVLEKDFMQDVLDPMIQVHGESQVESSKINGVFKMLPGCETTTNNGGLCHVSSPSTASFSPSRYQLEGEYDLQFNVSGLGHGLVPILEAKNSVSPLKQGVVDMREHEREILQLKKHLADYSIKEARITNEKFALEKRIAYMRMAFDQQQQDLVEAASKALSYRQDIIEENIRLTYALQDAQEERSTFVSSLMPLLAEYSLQPAVVDAQSIVSNIKVLFRHLQEKLVGIETKLKESQYQLAAWRSDVNPLSFGQSPFYSFGNKDGLELVPQQAYAEQITVIPDHLTSRGWDVPVHQGGLGSGVTENLEPDDTGRYSPHVSRETQDQGTTTRSAGDHGNLYPSNKGEQVTNKQVTFSDRIRSDDIDELDAEGHRNEGEPFVTWNSKNSPFTTTLEDPNSSYSPYLPPVLEEPTSSLSEAADDDPLPAVESLQISGEAFPGRELLASGYSLNGTTSCNFEWVRHMEDGSVNYIEGAKQPNYLVTADDIDTYLAIEVQPMDNRKRKGELVKVFANEHRKIACDTDMNDHIRKTLQTGHALYRLSLWTGYLDIWEPATLAVKREGYSIKGNGVAVTEKFSPSTTVLVPCGNALEFSIIGLGSVERRLRVEQEPTDISCSRDTVVLVMRLFIKRAVEKKKVKRKGLFFNK